MPVTLNLGMRMSSWFDLRSLDPNEPEDEAGIESASKTIHELIAEQEKQGVPNERIIVGGFSQGGALALYAALTYPKKLAGVVALSCWLPLHEKVGSLVSDANKSLAVLQCHGEADPVVPLEWGVASESVITTILDKSGYKFKVYEGVAHHSSPSELNDVMEFIKKQLPN